MNTTIDAGTNQTSSAGGAPGAAPQSKRAIWIGRVLSAIPALMLLASGTMKLLGGPDLAKGFEHLGLPFGLAVPLGILEIACTIVYLVPQTAVLGAILLTGYMGGAILTHVRIGEPWFAQAGLGVVLWLGVFLRDPRLRAILPLRRL